MKGPLSDSRCILFARGMRTDVDNAVALQLRRLRHFADRRKLSVVGEVVLENTSAMSAQTGAALLRLLERKAVEDDFALVIAADISRISRGDICDMTHMIMQFAHVGVTVVTIDGGPVDATLFSTFQVRIPQEEGMVERK